MFDGIKNSFKGTANTSRRAIKEIAGMAKEVKNMPWKKLKFTQWLYIIFGIIFVHKSVDIPFRRTFYVFCNFIDDTLHGWMHKTGI